jgi:hypothetical protein
MQCQKTKYYSIPDGLKKSKRLPSHISCVCLIKFDKFPVVALLALLRFADSAGSHPFLRMALSIASPKKTHAGLQL